MTLHNITQSNDTTLWWYAAIPNERRGTSHLLRVPAFIIDPNKLHIPTWMSQVSATTYRTRCSNTPIVVPSHLYPENNIARMCNRRQAAIRWDSDTDHYYLAHGVCPDCLEYGNAHRDLIGTEQRGPYARTGVRITQNTRALGNDPSQWRSNVESDFYGR